MEDWFVVDEPGSRYHVDIVERSFRFSVNCIALVRDIELKKTGSIVPGIVVRQFLRSATSVGANIEEAQSAESRRDFIHKMRVAQKEARETRHWIRLIRESGIHTGPQSQAMLEESDQILRIVSSIIVSTQKRP